MHHSEDQGRALARISVALVLAASAGCLLIWFAANSAFRKSYVEEMLTDLETDARALSALIEQTSLDHSTEVALRAAARLSPSISHDGIPVDLWLLNESRAIRFPLESARNEQLDLSGTDLLDQSVGAARSLAEIVAGKSRATGVWTGADGVRRLASVEPVPSVGSVLAVTVPMTNLEGRLRAQSAPWTAGMGFIALLVIPLAFALLHTAYGRATRRSLAYAGQLEEVTSAIPAVVFQAVTTPGKPGLRYVFLSEPIGDLFGVTPEEVIKDADVLQRRFHPDDLPLIRRAAAHALDEHVPLHIDHRIIHEDGSIRWLRVLATPRIQDDGDVTWTGVATDITAQKVTELALLRTQAAVDHAGDAVFWINRAGRFVYVNEAACRSLGFSRAALMELSVSDIDPDHPAEGWDELWETVHQHESWESRSRHRAADGRVFPVEIRSNCLDFEGEQIICAYARDVTETMRAQAELEQSEREFRLLADNVPAMFTYIDTNGEYRYANKEYAQRFQLSPEALIGKRYRDVLGDTASDVLEGFVKQVIRGERVQFEIPIRDESLGTRWMSSTYVPSVVEGHVEGFFALTTDITERKELETRLRDLTDHIPGVVYSYDSAPGRARQMLYMSAGMDHLLGVDAAAEAEADFDRFFERFDKADLDRVAGLIDAAERDGSPLDIELRARADTGQLRWLRSVARAVLMDDQTTRWHVALIDVTDRHRAEEALVETNRTLQLLLSELDHRVKNSLSGLLSLIDLSSQQDTDVPQFASAIRQRIAAMAAAHTLLSDSHWLPIELREIVDTLVPAEAPGRITVAGPHVRVPAAQVTALGMVIQELMTNSVKYGSLGAGGVVDVSWQSSQDESEQTIVDLRWRETGAPPLPSEHPPGRLGTRLIQGFVTTDLRGSAELTYPPQGADHHLRLTLGSSHPALTGESAPHGAARKL